MLWLMLGVSRVDRIRNVNVRLRVGVANVNENMRQCRLRYDVVRSDEIN